MEFGGKKTCTFVKRKWIKMKTYNVHERNGKWVKKFDIDINCTTQKKGNSMPSLMESKRFIDFIEKSTHFIITKLIDSIPFFFLPFD